MALQYAASLPNQVTVPQAYTTLKAISWQKETKKLEVSYNIYSSKEAYLNNQEPLSIEKSYLDIPESIEDLGLGPDRNNYTSLADYNKAVSLYEIKISNLHIFNMFRSLVYDELIRTREEFKYAKNV